MKNTKFLGALAIMFAAFLWCLDGVLIRPKLYSLNPGTLVFLEHFLGFLILLPFIFIDRKKIKNLKPSDWSSIVWVSIFGGLLGTLAITKAFFAAVHGETTFATVILLQKLQPFFALFIARIILKERLPKKFYLWSTIAIASSLILAFSNTGFSFSSIQAFSHPALLAIFAAFAFGSSTVLGKKAVNHINFKTTTALRFGLTSILAFLLLLTTSKVGSIAQLEISHWKLIFAIIFSSGALSMLFYYYGLKKVSASTATICELFWPFSAIILDFIINKNTLSPTQILASTILLIAFYKIVKADSFQTHSFRANIVSGDNIGNKLGFPTINLDKTDMHIPHGVYLVEATINGAKYKSLMHFGHKETFSNQITTEIYIQTNINLKQKKAIKILVIKKIRDIKNFKSPENLRIQIQKDLNFL